MRATIQHAEMSLILKNGTVASLDHLHRRHTHNPTTCHSSSSCRACCTVPKTFPSQGILVTRARGPGFHQGLCQRVRRSYTFLCVSLLLAREENVWKGTEEELWKTCKERTETGVSM